MEPQSRHYHGRRAETNSIKPFASRPYTLKYRGEPLDDSQYDRDDRTSRSNTPPSCPSMTHCSSTSASSIIACVHGADAGQCHACQNLADLENYTYQQFEADSPRSHPAILLRHKGQERLWSSKFVKQDGYENTVPRNVISHFSHVDGSVAFDGLAHEICEEETCNGQHSKQCPNNLPETGVSSASKQGQHVLRRSVTADENSESDVGDDENEEEDDEEDEEDEDDWSGQDDNLEARLVEALGHDLSLAAYLIPLLYKVFHSEVSANIKQKVGPWCHDVTKCTPGMGTTSSGKTSSSNAAGNESNLSNNDLRKRSRGLGSLSHDQEPDEEEEDEGDEDDDKREPKRPKNHPDSGGLTPNPRLACPFYKLDPSKYGVQHEAIESGKRTDYRVCAGPGFKSITRLKEHLKRKHYPVQCERCYHIFEGGPDRAARARELEIHRQLPHPCERGDASLKEGISDAQWASLDRKKKNQGPSNIEKWNEIWVILFPGTSVPKTPWYDQSLSEITSPPPSEGCSQFLELFKAILDHKVGQQHIRLEEGMQTRVVNAVQVAFETWSRTFRSDRGLSSTDSSSAPQTSYLDGSWQHIPPSRPSRTHRLSTNSQAYSMDISGSPPGSSVMKPRRGQRDSTVHGMDPRFMAPPPQYDPNAIGGRIPTEHRTPAGYPIDIHSNIDPFEGAFTNNPMEASTDHYFNMDYNAPGVSFNDENVAARAAFASSSGGISPNQTLINSPANTLHHNMAGLPHNNWSHQYPGPGRSHYTGGQP